MKLIREEGRGGECGVADLDAGRAPVEVEVGLAGEPGGGGSAEISSMTVRRLVRGLTRQFMVTRANMRYSVQFHVDMPGG